MKRQLWLLILIIVFGVALRLALIVFLAGSYKPIDILIVDRQVPKLILDLQNPYTHTYPVDNYTLSTFAYLPVIPIYYVPFYLLGDIRYGNIFADVLIMLAAYLIAKPPNFDYNCKNALYAPLVFAVLPLSFWLTCISATNFMIGTAFMMLALAFLIRKNFAASAVFLGLGVAANQFIILLLPLFGVYYWKERRMGSLLLSVAVSAAIILPFFLATPSNFVYDVFTFQFTRALQSNGAFSLYSIATSFGVQLSTWIRIIIFAVPFLVLTFWKRRSPQTLLLSACGIMLFAAFFLPVDGFYNYFLPASAIVCALIPLIINKIHLKIKKRQLLPKHL